MDALKFLKERKRMCESFGSECTECPANSSIYICRLGVVMGAEATEQVKLVEEWSAAHPAITQQDIFKKTYPNAVIDQDGVLLVCPKYLDKSFNCVHQTNCPTCRKNYWLKEVQDGR